MKAQRSDAARNTARVLEAAARLFRERGAEDVTMEDIARAAGIGKATLYRRFPDRAAVAVALLDAHERELQERMIRGEPPLGPGAPPVERLVAFYAAMVDLLEAHGHLVLATEVGHRRFSVGAYGFWRAHVLSLLREADVADPEALVDLLLAPVAPDVYRFQRRDRRIGLKRVRSGLEQLARQVLG